MDSETNPGGCDDCSSDMKRHGFIMLGVGLILGVVVQLTILAVIR